ncbi:MAG: PUA domain-containing protein, partial [Nitrososphaerales archaeon]
QGRTVFCKHVVDCADLLRAGQDVAVLNEKGELLAAGRTLLSGPTIKQFKRGAAVKIREGSSRKNAPPDEF